jgi:putative flippase GtrA
MKTNISQKTIVLAKKYHRFIKFGIVGLSNTAISLAVYYLAISIGIYYQLANVFAFIVSSLSGFYLNRSWVFKASSQSIWFQMIKYYMVYCSSLLISLFLSFIWIELFHLSKYIAPLLNLLFTIPFNYLLNKKWAFRQS